MGAVAWILFVSGTLMAALFGAKVPPDWTWFGVGVVLAIAGAVLLRKQIAAKAGSGSTEEGGIRDLDGLQAGIQGIANGAQGLASVEDPDALKDGVEDLLLERLVPVVEARMMLASSHGIEAYAKVYTPLASAERCLNRAWSALVDGHPEVAGPQIEAAAGHVSSALDGWPQ